MSKQLLEFVNKDGWLLQRTSTTLLCSYEQKQIFIQYNFSDKKNLTFTSVNPNYRLIITDESEFNKLRQSLISQLEVYLQKQLPLEIKHSLLTMPITSVDSTDKIAEIKTEKDLEKAFHEVIASDNLEYLQAIFQHFYEKKFNADVQQQFWFVAIDHLNVCLMSDRFVALLCFKYILEQADKVRDSDAKSKHGGLGDAVSFKLHRTKFSCLNRIAWDSSQTVPRSDEDAVSLSGLVMSYIRSDEKHSIIKASHAIHGAAEKNKPKLLAYLLSQIIKHKYDTPSCRDACEIALREYNFDCLAPLLLHSTSILFDLYSDKSSPISKQNLPTWLAQAKTEMEKISDKEKKDRAKEIISATEKVQNYQLEQPATGMRKEEQQGVYTFMASSIPSSASTAPASGVPSESRPVSPPGPGTPFWDSSATRTDPSIASSATTPASPKQ